MVGQGVDLRNTPANIKRIDNTPLEQLGEDGPAIVFDVPAGLQYHESPVEDVLWTGTGILVWYDHPEHGRDYFRLAAEARDGEIVVTGYGPGMLSAREAFEERADAPHAESLRPIYEWLLDEDVRFEDYDE